MGERGTLSLLSHLPDNALMVELLSGPVNLGGLKRLISKEQPHRELSDTDHSGMSRIRAIPIFIISQNVAEEKGSVVGI